MENIGKLPFLARWIHYNLKLGKTPKELILGVIRVR